MNAVNDTSTEPDFAEMEKGFYYTLVGVSGDQWVRHYTNLFEEYGAGTPKKWVFFTGAQLNSYLGINGKAAFSDDHKFTAFSPDGLNLEKLEKSMRLSADNWFSEVVAWARERALEFRESSPAGTTTAAELTSSGDENTF